MGRREYWPYSQGAQRGERPFSWQPQTKKSFQGNARNRPHGGVARRLFGSAKRRSSLLALQAISGIRMYVPYASSP
ncbi:hypothetical protein BDI4_2340002 [Burkholderia diffusa]|nr:hypothetical protein BDI4_2340002 [Burkholderia diffusa]